MSDEYRESNRTLWEEWTRLHIQAGAPYHKELDQLQAGVNTLDPEEQAELGDVSGKTMLHLQCHLGLTTLAWARAGASVTGVDWTAEAIAYARSLSQTLAIPAEFICSDVYDLPAVLDRQFDLVYTSEGVIAWLPDLTRWGEIIAHFLKPGGILYLRDGHPLRHLVQPRRLDAFGQPIELGYFDPAPTAVAERGSYAVPEAPSVHTAYYWTHNLGEIVTALCAAGLKLEFLHEFPKVAETCYTYEETGPGEWTRRELHNVAIPRAFSIRAHR